MINEDAALRPKALTSFVGQDHFKDNLQTFIISARIQNKALDHLLLFGSPGLGKTTLAQIIAEELNTNLVIAMAPALSKTQDVIKLLAKINFKDVLFIDEIHRLNTASSEILYPVMEDFKADITFGEGSNKKMVRASIEPFTLIGATTRAGMLPQPLRDRFGIHLSLALYSAEQLQQVIASAAPKLPASIDDVAAWEIARRARGTPRIALQLLRRCHDFSIVAGDSKISAIAAQAAMHKLGIDNDGLTCDDHRYLKCLAEQFGGGPAGVEAIAAAMGDERDNVTDLIEPYLLQAGFINRTARGRILSEKSLSRYMPGLHFSAA